MTRKIGNTLIIEPESFAVCEFCNKLDELRPYGPKNERICFDCAMKDKATTESKFGELLDGPGEKPQ
jgi:hypothetical protein